MTSSPSGGFRGAAHFSVTTGVGVPTIAGAPYSGEEVSEQVQTLADGTHITRKSTSTKIYRDSLGRTRTERPLGGGGFVMTGRVQDSPVVVEIEDPTARVKYTLDPAKQVAHRQQWTSAPDRAVIGSAPRPAQPRPAQLSSAVAPRIVSTSGGGGGGGIGGGIAFGVEGSGPLRVRPETTSEKLGAQTIEGVLAEGMRNTTTWPIDSQGNDRPIAVVNETWISPTLKVMIMNKTSDPRTGEQVRKLTNISVAEPDASLFQPPPGYTVVDETGDFTIEWGAQ